MISHDFADITTAIDIYMDAFMRDARNAIPKPYAYGVFKKDTSKNDRIGKMVSVAFYPVLYLRL